MCEKYKRQDPRRFSTLETIPRRWQRVETDMGSWCHPGTRGNSMSWWWWAVLSLTTLPTTAPGRPFNQVFTESWLPIFGQPQVLRVDPQGPMMSKHADSYASEHGMELQPIPAEARWQINLVEGAIKTTKGMMETLSGEFPDMPPAELLGRAFWVTNCRDLFKTLFSSSTCFG